MAIRRITVRNGAKIQRISPDQLYALRQDLDAFEGVDTLKERCYCACHSGGKQHPVNLIVPADPCCVTCPTCSERIRFDVYPAHEARHQAELG